MTSNELAIHRGSSHLSALEGFPTTERWRLFTDLDRQHREPDVFDLSEPGYLNAMWNAFTEAMNALGTKVSAESFCHMHDRCVEGVRRRIEGDSFRLGYATGYTYGLPHSKITSNAKSEWLSEKLIWTHENTEDNQLYLATHFNQNVIPIRNEITSITQKITDLFAKYYNNISNQENPNDRLNEIVNLCRSLEIFHPFPDGNQRTIAFVLLPKLLLENGFSVPILENPFLFDGGFSTQEMAEQVRRGMEHFNCVKNGNYSECSHTLSIQPRSMNRIEMYCAIQEGSERFMRAILSNFNNENKFYKNDVEYELVQMFNQSIKNTKFPDSSEDILENMIRKFMKAKLYALSLAIVEILNPHTHQRQFLEEILSEWIVNHDIHVILSYINYINYVNFKESAWDVLTNIAQSNNDGETLVEIAKSIQRSNRFYSNRIFKLSANIFLVNGNFASALTVGEHIKDVENKQELTFYVYKKVVAKSSLSELELLIQNAPNEFQYNVAYEITAELVRQDRLSDASYIIDKGFLRKESARFLLEKISISNEFNEMICNAK